MFKAVRDLKDVGLTQRAAQATKRVQALLRAPSAAEKQMRRELTRVSSLTPARYKLPFDTLRLKTLDHVELAAWWIAGERANEAVVLHHHFGGQRATLLPWIRLFHELGYSVLAFDGRGHGESTYHPKRRETFAARVHDMHAACDAARLHGAEKLVVLGQSQGSIPALLAAAERDDVRAVIVDCGPAPSSFHAAFGLARAMLERGGQHASPLGMTAFAVALLVRGRPLYDTSKLWRALVELRQKPLLWIHGDRDRVIRREWSELWYSTLATRDTPWRSLCVPGGEHVRSVQTAQERVRNEVSAFLCL